MQPCDTELLCLRHQSLHRAAGGDVLMGPRYSCDGAEFSVAPQGIDAVKLLS